MAMLSKLFQKPSPETAKLMRQAEAAAANRAPAEAPYLTPHVMDTLATFFDAVAIASEAAVALGAALDAVKPVGEAAAPTLYDLQSLVDILSGRLDAAHKTSLAMALELGMTSDLLDVAVKRVEQTKAGGRA